MKLFDGDESENNDLSKIQIDHEFAKRYEYNKKREDLQRFEELKKNGRVGVSGSDSEDSSFSDEEFSLEPSKNKDFEFFDALIKVKNQDPVLKDKDAKLFYSDSESNSKNESDIGNERRKGGTGDGRKGKKPMYLKDVISKQLIETGPEFDDEQDDQMVSKGKNNGNKVKTYNEEQEEFTRDILKAIDEGNNHEEEDGDFFRVKEGDGAEEEEEESEIGNKLHEYFGEDENLDSDSMFLKNYFREKMWLGDGRSNDAGGGEIEFSEDEDEIERQEDYEREFNFRFEENAGDRVMGHSRRVEGSVRKKENSRKLQRDRKDERIAQAEFERMEELKYLKNLKKKEINEKLQKIREVSGIGKSDKSLLDEDYLEEEFDPEEYDRKMGEAFDDEYYKAEDVDPEFGSGSDEDGGTFQKPDFDEEDELLGLPKNWDDVKESGEGFASARRRILERTEGDGDENELLEDGCNESKRSKKRKPSEIEKAVREQLMEEYYKLDYEDTVGDLKTRFKYRPVKPRRYGLTPDQIVKMDEKDLNQYVSLKKLAPYREKEWKVPRIKTMQLKQINKNPLHGETSNFMNKDKKKLRHGDQETTKVVGSIEDDRTQPDELNGDVNNVSRRSKRRQRQAELKLSRSTLIAYGKIQPKSKSKKQ
ncbi:protein kri1-like [Primulina huaijiensis]|uniref:protein kri1-like n=1 Tax=Primulina huaijiensis TaxID=1492673 RepID=UPI003CC73D4D